MPFSGYDLMTRIASVHKAAAAATDRHQPDRSRSSRRRAASARRRIAFNLAVALGQLGQRTVLDRRQPPVRRPARAAQGAARRARRSWTCRPTGSPSRTSRDVLWRDPSGIDILLAPPRIEMAEMVTVARPREDAVAPAPRLRRRRSSTCRAASTTSTSRFLDAADTILEIVTYDSTTIHNTIAMADTFRAIGYPPTKVRYLVNRADATGGIDPDDLEPGARPRAGAPRRARTARSSSREQRGRPVRARRPERRRSARTSSRSRRRCSALGRERSRSQPRRGRVGGRDGGAMSDPPTRSASSTPASAG